MKKNLLSLAALGIMTALLSCSRQESIDLPANGPSIPDSSIVFTAGDEFQVVTRANAVTSLDKFNCIATKSDGEALAWDLTEFTGSGDPKVFTGGKYWPSEDAKYHFYASNVTLAYANTGCMVSPADNTTDVVVAYKPSPTYNQSNQLDFKHIYARVNSIQFTPQTPSNGGTPSLSNIGITLKNAVTGGTYNLKTDAWTPSSTKADKVLDHSTTNDLYVVPGTYVLEVEYTYTIGDYTKTFLKTQSITLKQGCTNNITGTLTSDAKHIEFKVSIASWTDNNISVTY